MPRKHGRIAGMGAYLPDRVVTNAEIGHFLGVSEEWIIERCGIHERRYAAIGEGTASMAAQAFTRCIADAGWKATDIDFVIFATLSPDHHFPGSGVYMQALLELPSIAVMDIRNQCSGFLYAFVVGDALISAGTYQRIVIIGAETHSHTLEVPDTNKEVAVLFGDGAAAIAIEAGDKPGLLASTLHADGSGAEALKLNIFDISSRPYITPQDIEDRRHIPVMDGPRVFIRAVSEMVSASREVLEKAGMTLADVDLFIPHQANLRINETVRRRLRLPPEKVFNNIQTRGNTTAASIPLAMTEARDAGVLKRGQLVLIAAFGSGFTWGAALVRF